MWILACWLEKYRPEVQIVNGDMVLEKLCVVSGNPKTNNSETDETALLIQDSAGSLWENTCEEEILLSNRG